MMSLRGSIVQPNQSLTQGPLALAPRVLEAVNERGSSCGVLHRLHGEGQ